MKRALFFFSAFALSITLSACGQQDLTWQEQYDLGVRYLSEGNYEEAIIAFTSAIEIDPKQALAYVGRGDAYVGSGEMEETLSTAQADYEIAIELDGMCSTAYLGLAEISILQNDVNNAILILQKGLDATGDSALQQKILDLQNSEGTEYNRFEHMLIAGETDKMLSFEEMTFLGQPLRKMSIEELAALMSASGMNPEIYDGYDYNTRHVRAQIGKGGEISAMQYNDVPYADIISFINYDENSAPTGIRDLMMNDPVEALFTALGFSNGSEISAYIYGMIAEANESGSFTQGSQSLNYSNSNFNIQVNGLSTLIFSLSMRGYKDYLFSFTYSPVSSAESIDHLSDFSILFLDD